MTENCALIAKACQSVSCEQPSHLLILHFVIIVEVFMEDLGEQEEIDVAGDLVTCPINILRVGSVRILIGPMTFCLASAQHSERTIHQTIIPAEYAHAAVSTRRGHGRSILYI